MSQHVFSSGLLRKGILWYFLSFFVKFPRHWQLNQLRLNTAGIESHTLRQGHANVAPWQKLTLETRKRQKTAKICKISAQTSELHMAAAQHLKLWEAMLGKQVAGSPWSNARTKSHQLSACSQAQRKHINAKQTRQNTSKYMEKIEKNWEEKHVSIPFRVHVAPRVKSRFAVGGSRRGRSPKMLKTRSLPT